jgi:proline racemase
MRMGRLLTTIDTHTAGGPTRILTGGIPPLPGGTVGEKMEHFRLHHDGVRRLLMHEPRGHRDMAGAVITEATRPDADLGVFFLTAAGYLPACVHSSIGVAVAGLETGFLPSPSRPDGTLRLEVPAGVVTLIPEYEDGMVRSVALRTPPAFVHSPLVEVKLEEGVTVPGAVVFSGVFFLVVEAGDLSLPSADGTSFAGPSGRGFHLGPKNAARLGALGVRILAAANRDLGVVHPQDSSAAPIALLMICQEVKRGHELDLVVSRTGAIDRSPCGAGTGARVVQRFVQGRLGLLEDHRIDSFLGTSFTGRVVEPASVGDFEGGIPEVRGSAFITGMHQFILDCRDNLPEGFIF